MEVITVKDQLAIRQIISLYGHLLDDREYNRLPEIFTSDAVFDLTPYGGEKHVGLTAILELMTNSQDHPVAHHASNVFIIQVDENTASVKSKGIGVGRKGRVGSVTYDDIFIKTSEGWRVSERCVSLKTG